MRDLEKLHQEILERNVRELELAYKELIRHKRTHCAHCDNSIEEWEEVEQTDNELIQYYHCSWCGFNGAQHYKLEYSHTEEIV